MSLNDEKSPLLSVSGTYDDEEYFYDSIKTSTLNTIGEQTLDMETSRDDLMASRRSLYKSIASHTSLMTLLENVSHDRRASLPFTIFNIHLILLGSSTFGLPYAILCGGLPFIATSVVFCLLADITGQILVDCMYEVSPKSKRRKRVYGDLSDMAYACWGNKGRVIMNCTNVTYFLFNNVVNVVLVGKCFHDILESYTSLSITYLMIIFSPIFLPLMFIKRMSIFAYTSGIGVMGIVIGVLTSLVNFIQNHQQWSVNAHVLNEAPLEKFPVAIGILMYTVMINSILPQVEGSVRDPKQVPTALHISYIMSTILKIGFGVLGVLTFGIDTQQLVSLNVSTVSPPSKFIIAICLIIYAASNFPVMFMALFEQLDHALFRVFHKEITGFSYHIWSVFIRVSSVVLCVGIAIFVPYFALVSGLVGAVIGSGFIFIFPITFHLQLKWKQISLLRKILEIILLIVGVCISCIAIYASGNALVEAIKADL